VDNVEPGVRPIVAVREFDDARDLMYPVPNLQLAAAIPLVFHNDPKILEVFLNLLNLGLNELVTGRILSNHNPIFQLRRRLPWDNTSRQCTVRAKRNQLIVSLQ
jgi:hypothetical protein